MRFADPRLRGRWEATGRCRVAFASHPAGWHGRSERGGSDLCDGRLLVGTHADRWEHRRLTNYVYDLSDPERDALTAHFLSTKKLGCSRLACFALESTDPFANIARQVEREVFE